MEPQTSDYRDFWKEGREAHLYLRDGKDYEIMLYQRDDQGLIVRVLGTQKSLFIPWVHIERLLLADD